MCQILLLIREMTIMQQAVSNHSKYTIFFFDYKILPKLKRSRLSAVARSFHFLLVHRVIFICCDWLVVFTFISFTNFLPLLQ